MVAIVTKYIIDINVFNIIYLFGIIKAASFDLFVIKIYVLSAHFLYIYILYKKNLKNL